MASTSKTLALALQTGPGSLFSPAHCYLFEPYSIPIPTFLLNHLLSTRYWYEKMVSNAQVYKQ